MSRKWARFAVVPIVTVLAAAAFVGSIEAKGPPPGAGGGHGGGEVETLGNNLSIPAVFVPSTAGAPALRVTCGTYAIPGADGAATAPEYPGYWLQKSDATWSADCTTAATASVVADWGDNLTNGMAIAAGKPVRVEVGLLDPAATGMRGFSGTNLTPELEDRVATYGTRGTSGDAFVTGDAGAPLTRVWDAGAHLKIERLDAGGNPTAVIFDGSMTAEINSMGAVVYGYNWGSKGRVNSPAAGTYRITFTTVNTTITGIADAAAPNVPQFTPTTTTVTVTLSSTHGGGGGGHGKP